jgi:small subunit ribosomal protein S6
MMVVVSGQLPEDLAQEMTGKAKKTIEEVGGLKVAEDFWGRRRLAYKIQGQDHGYYAVFNFSLEPQKISELEAEIKMISEIIRFMVISDEQKQANLKESKIKKDIKEESFKEKPKEEAKLEEVIEETPVKDKPKKSVKKVKDEKVEKESIDLEDAVKDEKSEVVEDKEDDNRLEELDKKIDEILND